MVARGCTTASSGRLDDAAMFTSSSPHEEVEVLKPTLAWMWSALIPGSFVVRGSRSISFLDFPRAIPPSRRANSAATVPLLPRSPPCPMAVAWAGFSFGVASVAEALRLPRRLVCCLRARRLGLRPPARELEATPLPPGRQLGRPLPWLLRRFLRALLSVRSICTQLLSPWLLLHSIDTLYVVGDCRSD